MNPPDQGASANTASPRSPRWTPAVGQDELARIAAEAPARAALIGLVGSFAFWLLALASRGLTELIAGLVPRVAAITMILAKLWYWGAALPGAVLLVLLPMSIWGRASGGHPPPSWLKLWSGLGASLVTIALYRGEPIPAAGLLVALVSAPLLRARAPLPPPTVTTFTLLVRVLWEIAVIGPILAVGLLLPEPPWLAQGLLPRAPEASGIVRSADLRLLLSISLSWLGVLLIANRLYHCARAGRLDPARTWLASAALLIGAAMASIQAPGAWLTRTVPLAAACLPIVWVAARRRPEIQVRAFLRIGTRSLVSPGFFGALWAGLVFDSGPAMALSSAVVGATIALGVVLAQRVHPDRPTFLVARSASDADRDHVYLNTPARLSRSSSRPATGRALRSIEQAVTSLLAWRETHPWQRPPPAHIFLPPSEAGALEPLLLALKGRRGTGAAAVPPPLRPLLWLAEPATLLAHLDRDPRAVSRLLEELVAGDRSEVRRLTWSVLLTHARAHLGQIDGMVRDVFAILIPEEAAQGRRYEGAVPLRIRENMGRSPWMDLLEAQGAPFPEEQGRPGLLSTNVRIEWASALRERVDRVVSLAVTTYDPAARRVLQEQRASLNLAMAPLKQEASASLIQRQAARAEVEDLLHLAWLHRWEGFSEADDALLDELLRRFWAGGFVPLLARAEGAPMIAELLARALAEELHRELRPSDWFWENELWTDSIKRRLGDAARRAQLKVTAADWRTAMLRSGSVPSPRPELACLVDDDLRAGPEVATWMLRLSAGDPRALLMPWTFRAAARLPEDRRALLFESLTSWLDKPWVDQPDLALLLWEAAEIAVSRLPGGAEEARRLRRQRLWLAHRLGDDDDVAHAEGVAKGQGLVARRARAEAAETALVKLLDDSPPGADELGAILTAIERLAGGETVIEGLPELGERDTLLIQVLAGGRLFTIHHDPRHTRLTRATVAAGALMDRIDAWRAALRKGEDLPDAAREIARALGLSELALGSGTLHYVGIGALCRLPLAALPVAAGTLGRTQAWIRYDRPSRVPTAAQVWRGLDAPRTALHWSPPEHPIPGVVAEVNALDTWGFTVETASSAQVIRALASGEAVHLACHAVGGRIDNSDASLYCQDRKLKVTDLDGVEIRTPLVYLSSCESALGSLVAGQHPMGITGALLSGGAGHVISTQWPVRDDISAKVSRQFWRGLLSKGLSPPHALLEAVRNLNVPAGAWAPVEVHGGQLMDGPAGPHATTTIKTGAIDARAQTGYR